MNIIFVTICVNIAVVNAKYDFNNNMDLNKFLKLLKDVPIQAIKAFGNKPIKYVHSRASPSSSMRLGRRFLNPTNEREEVMSIIPGFYLVKPEEISKVLFRHPEVKAISYGELEKVDTEKEEKTKSNQKTLRGKEMLMAKILKAFNSREHRGLQKYQHSKRKKDTAMQQVFKVLKNIKQYRGKKKSSRSPVIVIETKPNKKLTSINTKRIEDLLNGKELESLKNSFVTETKPYEKFTSSNTKTIEDLLNGKRIKNLENSIVYKTKPYKKLTSSNTKRIENLLNGKELESLKNSIVIKTKPHKKLTSSKTKKIEDLLNGKRYESLKYSNDITENVASEILDLSLNEEDNSSDGYRRFIGKSKESKEKDDFDRDLQKSSEEEITEEESASIEKNPGNPFTIHKNKYKQNWLWNHYMDGDHMNINPLGPQFGSLGPSGPDLFFGRKWWYFNQDDYKPMG